MCLFEILLRSFLFKVVKLFFFFFVGGEWGSYVLCFGMSFYLFQLFMEIRRNGFRYIIVSFLNGILFQLYYDMEVL